MRNTALLGILAVLLGTACSESSPASPGAAPTIRASGTITDGQDGTLIEGARVCLASPVVTPERCVTTAADGAYALDLPAKTSGWVSAAGPEGYTPSIAWGYTGEVDLTDLNIVVAKASVLSLFAGSCGTTPDPALGHVAVVLRGPQAATDAGPDAGLPGVAGVTATLAPPAGTGACYAAESGLPSATLTESTASGVFGFFNAAPADAVTLALTPPAGQHCTYDLSPPGAAPDTFVIPVVAGAITVTQLGCE